MPARLTKAELFQQLAQFGELPPKEWTVLELTARLDELRLQHRLTSVHMGKQRTPLRKQVIALNEASRRKNSLIKFLNEELQMAITGNETIPVLQQKGLMKIYEITEASGEDPVGFGKHSSLSYHELKQTQPQYADWVVKTVKETEIGGTCDPRCRRLGLWLMEQLKMMQNPNLKGIKDGKQEMITPIPTEVLVENGYLKETSKKAATSKMSSASGSVTSSQMEATNQMIMQLTQVVADLKEEIQEIKTERPRKEVKKEDELSSSMGSFMAISEPK